jgi:hypothetical protein
VINLVAMADLKMTLTDSEDDQTDQVQVKQTEEIKIPAKKNKRQQKQDKKKAEELDSDDVLVFDTSFTLVNDKSGKQ